MQILIIDDNTEIAYMLSFYLENVGYECKVVNDGKEGLQAIKSENFDLALPYLSHKYQKLFIIIRD
jgi:CheY-like chemotaxis protein